MTISSFGDSIEEQKLLYAAGNQIIKKKNQQQLGHYLAELRHV